MKHIVEQARGLCRENDARLLFLTIAGSGLYGTMVPGKSDTDVRGIFMPSVRSLILGQSVHSLHLSSGNADGQNKAKDIDLDLWSLQHWLLKLLLAGDTGAMDVLFAASHPTGTLFKDARLDPVLSRPLDFCNTKDGRAVAAYALGQAKKYGNKGSRLGALQAVLAKAQALWPEGQDAEPIGRHVQELAAATSEQYCRIVGEQDACMLELCGKQHALHLPAKDFMERVERELGRYGKRADAALKSGGIDWKALSHALRAVRQLEEVLETGKLAYPLACAPELLRVKLGQDSFESCEARIVQGLAHLDSLRKTSPHVHEPELARLQAAVLACYERNEEQ